MLPKFKSKAFPPCNLLVTRKHVSQILRNQNLKRKGCSAGNYFQTKVTNGLNLMIKNGR